MNRGLVLLALLAFVAVVAGDFHGDAWENQTGADKLKQIWYAAMADSSMNDWPSALDEALLLLEQMGLTFDNPDWDEFMPNKIKLWPYDTGYNRTKLIHGQGVVALCSFVSNGNHNYTGMFDGATGLIRLSLASAPTVDGDSPTMAPGIAFKFMRDFAVSSNVIAMFQLVGQSTFNFFEHDLTNHVPDLGTSATFIQTQIRAAFAATSNWPTMLGLSEFASMNTAGKKVDNPNFPFRLVFHPTTSYHVKFAGTPPSNNVLPELAKGLVTGTTLFEVYAQNSPTDDPFTSLFQIGTIELASGGYTSLFSDKTMFMRHVRMEDDLQFHPDWATPMAAIIAEQQAEEQYYFRDLPWN